MKRNGQWGSYWKWRQDDFTRRAMGRTTKNSHNWNRKSMKLNWIAVHLRDVTWRHIRCPRSSVTTLVKNIFCTVFNQTTLFEVQTSSDSAGIRRRYLKHWNTHQSRAKMPCDLFFSFLPQHLPPHVAHLYQYRYPEIQFAFQSMWHGVERLQTDHVNSSTSSYSWIFDAIYNSYNRETFPFFRLSCYVLSLAFPFLAIGTL